MKALILAAGRGERMRPFTDVIPKPLLPVDGKAVVLRILETLEAAGFTEVAITIGYLGEKVKDFVELNRPSGLNVSYARQERLLGSADAIAAARGVLKGDFLTMAADTVFQTDDIRKIVETFRSGRHQAVVGLKKVNQEELMERSTAKIDRAFMLEQVIEKPRKGQELSLISVAPVYAFQAATIWKYLENLRPSSSGVYELAAALQQMIDDGGKIKGVLLKDSRDLTRPLDVLKRNFNYLDELLGAE
jgi:NDP-sugar pyrophosphorylase family protein